MGKNPFNADLQLFTTSSVSVLTHRGLFKSTLLSSNKFLQQPPVQAQALSRDSGLFILCHWSELRDEELISKQFSGFLESFSSFSTQLSQQLSDHCRASFAESTSLNFHLISCPFTSPVQPLWIQQDGEVEGCPSCCSRKGFVRAALCSTYTCNELNPPGSFIHCFKTCQSPWIKFQPSLSSGLHLMVCQSDIVSSFDEEREKKRQKEKGKKGGFYIRSCPSLPFISKILC